MECPAAYYSDGMSSMKIVVYRGHSVTTPAGTYMPGDTVELADDEAQRLIALGFVHRPGERVVARYSEYTRDSLVAEPVDVERARGRGTGEHTYQPAAAMGANR